MSAAESPDRSAAPGRGLGWDIFCHVVDNFGDVGVCWRLARELAQRGARARLFIDDAAALAWMAPDRASSAVQVLDWHEAGLAAPREVVIEAFGCDPPPGFVARMAARAQPPVWINLEYLSAEDYVERSHGLPSPQLAGPGRGLTKWFFFPGFGPGTGGLIREQDLAQRQHDFDAGACLQALGLGSLAELRARQDAQAQPGPRLVSAFGYEAAVVPPLARALAIQSPGPIHWLAPPSPLRQALVDGLGPQHRVHALPFLSQRDFDQLLWTCDLNLVRGEDSLVRALWAGKPMLWQIYPQADGAHAAKLQAFLRRAEAERLPGLSDGFLAWNGLAAMPAALPPWADWEAQAREWRARLSQGPELVSALQDFVSRKRTASG